MGETVKVFVFTRTPAVILRMLSARARKEMNIEAFPLSELREPLPSSAETVLVYLDVRGLSDKERGRALSEIVKNPKVCFGVLDPMGTVKDIAALFHAGAVDYVGKKLTLAAFTAKRAAAVAAYARNANGGQDGAGKGKGQTPVTAPVSDGWLDIVPGREHRFAFLFVEVDDAEELKKRHEPENLAGAMETFRGFVERVVLQHGGRLWMWGRFGGLALFPLHDSTSAAPLCGLRIILSRVFYDVEESLLPGRLVFHLALSVGTTVYQKGDTGRIVSDGVNSIFHLGRKYTQPGQFLLTAEAGELAPPALRAYLVPAGSFEGSRIMRMLRPRPSRAARAGSSSWET
jgi:class 3 adenylate cyclase